MTLFSRTWPRSSFTASSVVIGSIRVYQHLISPVLPRSCIYSPSCSSFAIEATRRYGLWRGGWLAARRLVRCGPWSAGGEDPVR